jgi:uridine kinase
MARWAPERRDTIRAVCEQLLQNYPRGRVVVGVDGPDATTRVPFADDLATELRALGHDTFRASLADFQQPRAQREARGVDAAVALYEHGYDYSAFRRVLLGPFRLAGATGFSTAFFDAERNVTFESRWQTGPADAILVVDGPYLLRPELRGIWNFTVRLDSEVSGAGAAASPTENEAQALYRTQVGPLVTPSVYLNMDDAAHPRQVFADSC